MEAYQAVLLALAALLVGALLPLVFQLLATVKAARALMKQAGPIVASVQATAARLDRISAKLEEGGQLEDALAAIESLTKTVSRLQEPARVASALGAAVVPALLAALEAWHAASEAGAAKEADGESSGAGGAAT